MDIFELEQKIMAAWQTENDIKLLYEQYFDGPEELSQDEVANALIGLYTIHSLRMNQLWQEFEKIPSARRAHP